jgi:hypothetical protein
MSLIPLAPALLLAQNPASIVTDRPDQTESSETAPVHYIQIEAGISSASITNGNRVVTLPTMLVRYGISDVFEARLVVERTTNRVNGTDLSGISPAQIGFKTRLSEEKGMLPALSFIGHLSLPGLSSNNLRSTYAAPSFRFTLSHSLSDDLALGYNAGADWDGESGEPSYAYTMALALSLTEALGCFGELYGYAPQRSIAAHLFNAGITYTIHPDLMFDLSGGVGLSERAQDNFISCGLSYRFRP